MTPDVVVIGGGPAGAASAIRLRQIALRVRLYEKARFPRPKLCGGFLSSESLMDLEALGVLPAVLASGALPVNRVRVCSRRGLEAEAAFQAPGLSLSRELLDAVLLERAREVGVEVHEGTDGWSHQQEGQWVVVATGRDPRGPQGYYGLQAYFEGVDGLSDQVELDLVPGGYVGLARQGSRRVTLCALTTQGILQVSGPSLDGVLAAWAKQSTVLNRHLKGAGRVSPWQAIGPVRMGFRRLAEDHRIYIGDAACVVDPFAGEGIAMGLKSSALLRDAFAQSAKPVEDAYGQAWRQLYDRTLRVQGCLRFLLSCPFLQDISVRGMRLFPPLLEGLAHLTRPKIDHESAQPYPHCRGA